MPANLTSSRRLSIGVLSLLSVLGVIGVWFSWPTLAEPLCKLVTFASTYSLQTLGYPAIAEGNVIVLGTGRVDVAEASGGLRMLVSLFVMSAAVATFVKRPAWERGLIVISAVHIAVICSVARVTVTAALAHRVFHDLAGWLMLPLALSLLGVELWILSRLLIAPPERDVVPVGSRRRVMSSTVNRRLPSFGEPGGVSPRTCDKLGAVRGLTASGSPGLSSLEVVTQL